MIRPYKDWIIVKRIERDEKTRGGIIIPKNTKDDKLVCGVVQAVHPNCETEELKKDMTVLYYSTVGLKVDMDGEELIFLKHDAPYAYIEEDRCSCYRNGKLEPVEVANGNTNGK